jgi:hypothetical protein
VPSATLSSIQGTHIAFKNSSNDNSKNTPNENALWFAVAPVLVAPSIQGAQPLYYRETDTKTGLPVPYSKAPYGDADNLQNDWTVKEIENFIRVSVGSVAQASSRNFKNQHPKPENVTSLIYLRKLDTGRVSYLIIPMLVILIGETVLLYSTVRLHERQKVPLMRMAPISELLNSCWTEFFLKYSEDLDVHDATQLSRLNSIKVMFGWTQGMTKKRVAGLSTRVDRFCDIPDPSSHQVCETT